jgi:hypothetical protein
MTYTHLIAFEGRSVTLGRQMAIVLMIAVLIAGCVILALKTQVTWERNIPKAISECDGYCADPNQGLVRP